MLEHILSPGRTYRFTFRPDFEAHGVCTTSGVKCLHQGGGVFRIDMIATYDDLFKAGIDLYSSFFKPLGISSEQYFKYMDSKPITEYEKVYATQQIAIESTVDVVVDDGGTQKTVQKKQVAVHEEQVETDKSRAKRTFLNRLNFRNYPIYKLVDVIDETDVIYAPELSIQGFPEVGIYHYRDVNLNINIGFWEDPSELEGMLFAVRERMTAFGVRPLKIDLFTSDHKWMTKEEYAKVKSINVPGTEVVLTEENKSRHLLANDYVIVGGELLRLVDSKRTEPPTPAEEGEIDVNDLLKRPVVLDTQLFLRQVDSLKDGAFFVNGRQYYRMLKNSAGTELGVYKKLRADVDYVIGETYADVNGNEFIQAADSDRDTLKTYYVKNSVFQESADTEPVEGKKYYKRTDATFEEVPFEETTDDNRWEMLNEGFIQATVEQIRGSYTLYTRVHASSTAPVDCLYILDYGNPEATKLVGSTFEYTTALNVLRSMDLTASDIVSLSADQMQITFPKCPTSEVTSDDTPFGNIFNKYKGRWFQYNVISDGVTYPLACRISDQVRRILPGKSGIILGEEGEVSKVTYIADNSQRRNYYALYMKTLRENTQLVARNQALEELIVQLGEKKPE